MNEARRFQKNSLDTGYEASQTLAVTGGTLGIVSGD
jgi:hypothetical protein